MFPQQRGLSPPVSSPVSLQASPLPLPPCPWGVLWLDSRGDRGEEGGAFNGCTGDESGGGSGGDGGGDSDLSVGEQGEHHGQEEQQAGQGEEEGDQGQVLPSLHPSNHKLVP